MTTSTTNINLELGLLKKLVEDVSFVKNKMMHLEDNIREVVHGEMYEVRPEYVAKLKAKTNDPELSEEEFERRLGVKI